ncbi:carbonic anhydrase [Pueribacillus theae]|uniref:carbonic anhydrase n=1 Tax=Pueribacillus theae TaxID=2171751 RepID=A0A2U1JS67_9BACI|nr:carbonic anhydrase [Pueribacillus theae]PWA08011.1 carbonic anhydrase [Pueribacillus theae]
MTMLDQILEFNRSFVKNKEYEKFETTKFPNKKLVILSCMDTRLVELLPNAMNVKNGDVKIIKNAGAIVSHPFGSIMRSILVAIYELNAQEVCVVGHYDCGMQGLNSSKVLEKAIARGASEELLTTLNYSGIDLDSWLKGFEKVEDGVRTSVDMIKQHPLLPKDIAVHGLIIDPETGRLDKIVDGYEK